MSRQIVLDTETTGLSPSQGHRIIEIGCIEIIDRVVTDNTFHCYINPEREIDAGAENVHGLTTDFLADKPIFAKIAQNFVDYIQDAELIIHNAPFDLGFLNHELTLWKKTIQTIEMNFSIIDTLIMARKKHPGQKNNLDALCRRYFIDNTERELHGALLDAQLLARVYIAMTGGQGSLFSKIENNIMPEEEMKSGIGPIKIDKQIPLKVIQASNEELVAHNDYLKMLAKLSEQTCRWNEKEEIDS